MSLHYFIDGYNVIRSSDRMSAGTLIEQRERLLSFIETGRSCGRNAVTVVFDGRPGPGWKAWRGPTRVIFSLEEDADSVIKRGVDEMRNAKDAVVVTNDRAIQWWVRGAHARVISCEEFLRESGTPPGPRGREKPGPGDAEEINDALRKEWGIDDSGTQI